MSKSNRGKKGQVEADPTGAADADNHDLENSAGRQDLAKLLALMVDSQKQAEERHYEEEQHQAELQRAREEREERMKQEEQKRQAEERRLEKKIWLRQREEDNKRWETLFHQQQEQFRMFREHAERETTVIVLVYRRRAQPSESSLHRECYRTL